MTTKSVTAEVSDQDTKYRALIHDCLREFKEIQKQIGRNQARGARLRSSCRGTMADTWEVLRRVEATL